MAQLVEAWTVNHDVGRSSPSCVMLTKSFQQAFGSIIAVSKPKLRGIMYHNNIVGPLTIHLCPSPFIQVLRPPGAVSSSVFCTASLRITLVVPEAVEN